MMNLTAKVVFIYHIQAGRFGQLSAFESIDELRQVIREIEYKRPFDLSILRNIQKFYPYEMKSKLGLRWQDFENMPGEEEITTDKINFVVLDRILYPQEIRDALIKRYGGVLNFQPTSETKPVFFYGVKSFKKPVFSEIKSEPVKHVNVFEANYRCAQDNEIIVDSNLNQIWPENTGKEPETLIQLLSKTKEIIR